MNLKYIVIGKEELTSILTDDSRLPVIDRIKIAVINELLREGRTMNDVMLIFVKYAINFQTLQAILTIRESIDLHRELPDEISFVTLRDNEDPSEWDNYGQNL